MMDPCLFHVSVKGLSSCTFLNICDYIRCSDKHNSSDQESLVNLSSKATRPTTL